VCRHRNGYLCQHCRKSLTKYGKYFLQRHEFGVAKTLLGVMNRIMVFIEELAPWEQRAATPRTRETSKGAQFLKINDGC
jgi:hypothetical protein